MNLKIITTAVIILALSGGAFHFSSVFSAASEFYPVPEPKPVRGNMTIVADYHKGFNRWSETTLTSELGNYGCYNSTAFDRTCDKYTSIIADWHIKWAVEHGIEVFSIQTDMSNIAGSVKSTQTKAFLNARYIRYIKFAIHLVDWRSANEIKANPFSGVIDLADLFMNERYWRIDGKPVLFFGSGYRYRQILGDQDLSKLISDLRNRLSSKGYEIFFVGDVITGASTASQPPSSARYFDALFQIGIGIPFKAKPTIDSSGVWNYVAPYGDVVSDFIGVYQRYSSYSDKLGVRYVPTIMPNFNSTDPVMLSIRYRRTISTDGKLWRTELVAATIEDFRKLATEAAKYAANSGIVYVWTWNEFHERTNVEPTIQQGFTYLDIIRDVFVGRSVSTEDITPRIYAEQLITRAADTVEIAKLEDRFLGLEEARKQQDEARAAYGLGQYEQAGALAYNARIAADNSVRATIQNLLTYYRLQLAVLSVCMTLICILVVYKQRQGSKRLTKGAFLTANDHNLHEKRVG